MSRSRADSWSVVGAISILLIAGAYSLWPAPATPASPPRPEIGWPREMPGGTRIGPLDARVTIVEFADYQCPYCATAHAVLKRALRAYDGKVAVIFHDLPLERLHPFARAAALAAGCAGAQGHFADFHDVLYENQSAIGHRPWHEFALDARVPRVDAFDRCVLEGRYAAAVARDSARATELGLTSTPIIAVNGEVYERAPSYAELRREIDGALRSSRP